jgi:hypothetical protein
MRSRSIFGCVALIAFTVPSAAQEGQSTAAHQPLAHMTFKDGRLTAHIENQSFQAVCAELASIAKVNFVLADGIAESQISLQVTNVPLEEAVRKLLAHYDAFYFYSASKGAPAALRSAWVYPQGTASVLQPASPEAWATSKDLEQLLSDTDPQAREAAYETLLSRPSPRSQARIVEALKGATEKDEAIRQRILADALSKGFPVPAEVLADLARADPSAAIRWMGSRWIVASSIGQANSGVRFGGCERSCSRKSEGNSDTERRALNGNATLRQGILPARSGGGGVAIGRHRA